MNNFIYKGHIVKKYLGQCFLIDNKVIKNIIDIINPLYDDVLIEIGPGFGALTIPVSNFVRKLFVIELDKDLVLYLCNNKLISSNVVIFKQNVMSFNFCYFSLIYNKNIRIFGNLPYNISVSLIIYFIRYINHIKDMYFMMQKEVVDKLISLPGNKNYCRLTVIMQYYYEIFFLFNVYSKSFTPSPRIDSSFVKIIPRSKNIYKVNNIKLFNLIVKSAFMFRRKMLRNSLSNFFTVNDLIKLNINPDLRAENISVYDFCKLSNNL
ncbi:16S rRNA (adenine(1518)-N(6)/adenine(1519)-N(6))-dimethyltransferase RsmA [Candidatus Purcelliella pentastirinorum]|uniref:16S rRNA (adenine(1518)-N(6)/adenine(1519)-N(6))- dimethyltransferase RsmA n=1 Tax=Candidatus Purcelliella pentastirinorum TaxID=472834 RepID=UPI0023682717|nr:16S rRNA (adenine(1518)-N(6)/adenine(1519)-N(6))-dimethyltransferase RsmA [Candidatus Purcelliella pentastirinorum]WDI79034.1 16S rRNA (adenine(1518)-N(6)/adenine(1519)-N(6))-dimethyltransferase RsmA [Candidatus Purcelliella pentastirinorum]WDR80172.1 16S rRNA (adenine(1518)-N(6)/adenine(1519)-N(6))-dimethyltransferase RsmA [Candidatus Purcelliella pentastirinorum]